MTDALECRLDVLDGHETLRYQALRAAMKTAVEEIRELADGYAARLRSDQALFRQVAEWITLERRCCPFLGHGGPLPRVRQHLDTPRSHEERKIERSSSRHDSALVVGQSRP